MENALLENNKVYIDFLNQIKNTASRVTIVLLNKDKTPSNDFIKTIENEIKVLPFDEATKKRGNSGTTIYRFFNPEGIMNYLFRIENFFSIEKTLLDEDYRTKIKNYRLKIIPNEIGFSNVVIHDSSGDLICETITHEGQLFINTKKYPHLKKFCINNLKDERYYFQ